MVLVSLFTDLMDDKTLTWDNSNSRLGFNTDLYYGKLRFVGGSLLLLWRWLIVMSLQKQLSVTGVSTFQSDVHLGDNDKLIFGDDDDLEIFHNSSNGNTIIQETTGGNLVIKGSNLFLQSSSGEDFFKGDANGAVTLYYDDSKKFETTGYGATVYNSECWNWCYDLR